MLRTTVASLLALGTAAIPAQAQTVLYGEPALQQPAPQPYYVDPTLVQPFQPQQQGQTGNPPLYYETPGSTAPPPPVYVEPVQQPPIFFQPEQEPTVNRRFRPVPRQSNENGVSQTRPITPVERYQPPAPPQAPPPTIARPEPRLEPRVLESRRFEPSDARDQATRVQTREAVRAAVREPQVTESEALRGFSEELARIVSLGERYRAASPGFLEDLKELAEKYRDMPVSAAAQSNLPPAPPQNTEIIGPPPAPTLVDTPAPPMAPGPVAEPQVAMLPETPAPAPQAPAPAPVELPQALPPTSAAVVYLRDDFADGEYLSNPAWNVRQGQWTIDPAFGLRPFSPAAAAPAQVTPQALLQYLIGDAKPEAPAATGDNGAALIEAQTNIGNAFSLVATITDHGGEGAAHFIMHQGGANWLGYRLELRAGPRPLVVLARRGSSGYKDIMKVEAPGFSTGKPHQLRWARLSDGQMFVLIDGKPIITARDTVFRQPWTGFGYFTAEADISMRNIRIAEPVER